MTLSPMMRAMLALLVWTVLALATGYYARTGIEKIFGPDSWWLVTGWIGIIVGLVHFLIILVFARQPQRAR